MLHGDVDGQYQLIAVAVTLFRRRREHVVKDVLYALEPLIVDSHVADYMACSIAFRVAAPDIRLEAEALQSALLLQLFDRSALTRGDRAGNDYVAVLTGEAGHDLLVVAIQNTGKLGRGARDVGNVGHPRSDGIEFGLNGQNASVSVEYGTSFGGNRLTVNRARGRRRVEYHNRTVPIQKSHEGDSEEDEYDAESFTALIIHSLLSQSCLCSPDTASNPGL